MTQRQPHQRREVTCECGERYCTHCVSICPACNGIHLAPQRPIEGPFIKPTVATPFFPPEIDYRAFLRRRYRAGNQPPRSGLAIEDLELTSIGVGKDETLGIAGVIKKLRRMTPSEEAYAIGEIRRAGRRHETPMERDDR